MTDSGVPPAPKPVNPATRKSYQQQIRWQVYGPLGLGLVLLGALVVGLGLAGVGDPSLWADLSIVLMAIPFCLLGLVLFAALVAAAFGVSRLVVLLPPYSFRAQRAMGRLRTEVLRAADVSVVPVVAARSGKSVV